jgi:cell fate regulator YaaT (PSP1 superfamily)
LRENDMRANLKKGDKVTWETSQGTTQGKVVKKQTSDTKIKSFVVKASKDDPQIIVESEKSGKRAAHRPDAVKKA